MLCNMMCISKNIYIYICIYIYLCLYIVQFHLYTCIKCRGAPPPPSNNHHHFTYFFMLDPNLTFTTTGHISSGSAGVNLCDVNPGVVPDENTLKKLDEN